MCIGFLPITVPWTSLHAGAVLWSWLMCQPMIAAPVIDVSLLSMVGTSTMAMAVREHYILRESVVGSPHRTTGSLAQAESGISQPPSACWPGAFHGAQTLCRSPIGGNKRTCMCFRQRSTSSASLTSWLHAGERAAQAARAHASPAPAAAGLALCILQLQQQQ